MDASPKSPTLGRKQQNTMTTMTTYSSSTIRRARTILANAERQQKILATMQARQPRKPAARTRTIPAPVERTMAPQDRDDVMATKDASAGQMRRINRLYREEGLREYTSLATFQSHFPNMLAASIEYRTLSA